MLKYYLIYNLFNIQRGFKALKQMAKLSFKAGNYEAVDIYYVNLIHLIIIVRLLIYIICV